MAIKSKTALKTLSDTTFTTNGVRGIQASQHRAFNDDAIDSLYTPAGSIVIYPKATPPTGWALCNGAILNKADYPDLFNALGGELSPYGVYPLNFSLPNITAGLNVIQNGTGYAIGAKGGSATHTLTVDEMPSHTHIQNPHNHLYKSGSTDYGFADGPRLETALVSQGYVATNQNTGGGAAHNNMPPYIVMNYIIKLY